jgi:hypothetical protein
LIVTSSPEVGSIPELQFAGSLQEDPSPPPVQETAAPKAPDRENKNRVPIARIEVAFLLIVECMGREDAGV